MLQHGCSLLLHRDDAAGRAVGRIAVDLVGLIGPDCGAHLSMDAVFVSARCRVAEPQGGAGAIRKNADADAAAVHRSRALDHQSGSSIDVIVRADTYLIVAGRNAVAHGRSDGTGRPEAVEKNAVIVPVVDADPLDHGLNARITCGPNI